MGQSTPGRSGLALTPRPSSPTSKLLRKNQPPPGIAVRAPPFPKPIRDTESIARERPSSYPTVYSTRPSRGWRAKRNRHFCQRTSPSSIWKPGRGWVIVKRSGRSAQRPRRERVEIGVLAGHGSVPVGVQKIDDLPGGQVHMRHHAFDGMSVDIAAGSAVIGKSAHNAAALGSRQRKVTGGPGHDFDGIEIGDAAVSNSPPPARSARTMRSAAECLRSRWPAARPQSA